VKIGKSASETLAQLTLAYGEYAMKKSSVFKWHMQLKKGQEDTQDDPHKWATKNTKDRRKFGQSMELSVLTLKI
jgi:hypothetical protein